MAGKAVAAIGPLSRDRRGAFAAMTAVIAPVMIGMTALSVDLGVWYLESNRLQTAADAAAVGAAYLLRSGSATAPYQAAALAEAKNATSSGYLIGTLQTPVVTVSSDLKTVTVTLTSKADGFFSRLFGSVPTMSATAKAGLKQQNSACVLALNQTISSAIKVDNMGSIVASGCGIFSDSSASDAISLNCGTVSGTSLGTVGGYYQSTCGNNAWSPGTPTTKASSIADPYAAKQAPTLPSNVSCPSTKSTYNYSSSSTTYNFYAPTDGSGLMSTATTYGNVF